MVSMSKPLYDSLKNIPFMDSVSMDNMAKNEMDPLNPEEEKFFKVTPLVLRRPSNPPVTPLCSNAKTACFRLFSLVYALAAVAVCLVFVIAELITDNATLYLLELFFIYMFGVSVLFLLYVLVYVLHESSARVGRQRQGTGCCADKSSDDENLNDGLTSTKLSKDGKPYKTKTSENEHTHCGFFLRIGAIAFGLGTMVYNGLEVGLLFDKSMSIDSWEVLTAVNPCLQALFTFLQMYFIFMNSRVNIHKFKCLARYGLMHLIATNICVWIRKLMQECLRVTNISYEYGANPTGRRILQISEGFNEPVASAVNSSVEMAVDNSSEVADLSTSATDAADTLTDTINFPTPRSPLVEAASTLGSVLSSLAPSLSPGDAIPDVDSAGGSVSGVRESSFGVDIDSGAAAVPQTDSGNQSIVANFLHDASPYLFPMIVQYSLIASAVLYMMWRHTGRCPRYLEEDDIPDHVSVTSRKVHTKVDCIGTSVGLFCGLLVLVSAVVSLVLFFVLSEHANLKPIALCLADSSHAVILVMMIIAMLIACCRNRQLKFEPGRPELLDSVLLRVSALGVFLYALFSVLAAALSALTHVSNLIVLVAATLVILEVFMQMLYLADVSKRSVCHPEHDLSKPGRQVVTFMLLSNLALWAFYTMDIAKVQVHPLQADYYGSSYWLVIQLVALPLAIFHRFYSSVVLAEVWKSSYKARTD